MRFPFHAAVLALLWPLAAAGNGCDGRDAAIIRAAWPDAQPASPVIVEGREITLSASDVHGVFCRQWPAHPQILLAAVPMMLPAGAAQDFDREGDLEVLVLDAASLAVQARLRLADFIQEDAIYLDGLSFDTAPYRLFGDRIAFGIRRVMTGSSRPNPYSQTELSLFDLQGDTLRVVLSDLVVAQGFGEVDVSCAGAYEKLTRVLDLAPGARAADIVVRGKHVQTSSREDTGQCVSTDTVEDLAPFTLRYDGRRYPLPDKPPPAAR